MDLVQVVIDDERSFDLGTSYLVFRSSKAAVEWLLDCPKFKCDVLWLDHDLGGSDTIMPFVDLLCERAFYGAPMDVGRIRVHSQNPTGADNVVRSLKRHGYRVSRSPLPKLAAKRS